MDLRGPYRVGAFFVLISAVLHLLAPLVGGFHPDALILIPIGALYLAVTYGLLRGWRWLAYLSFFGLAIGGIAALNMIWSASPVPFWWYGLIAAADGLGVIGLFVALWKPAPTPEA